MDDGLSDHDLLMEVREDVKWIKKHLGATVSRKEFYGTIATLITIAIGVAAIL